MLFILSTPMLIRHLWQLKTVVFLHWCQICAVPVYLINKYQLPVSATRWPAWDLFFNIHVLNIHTHIYVDILRIPYAV